MVRSKEAKTYIERLYCDKCGKEMTRDNVVYTAIPPIYNYKCECGHTEKSTMSYPATRFNEIEDDAVEVDSE